jgi:LuxR family maltose regulon positive regulatory protein
MLAYAGASTMYDFLASMQENAVDRTSALVGEQRQRLARQHRTDGHDCRWRAARALALLSKSAAQARPSLGTGSPDRIVSWAELEALAQQLAITGHAREPDTTALREQLSHREIEVLRYLPSMLTAGEIGAELCVSGNTVKAHLRSIYRRLGVARRRDAVVRAHHYGFLRGPISPDAHPV